MAQCARTETVQETFVARGFRRSGSPDHRWVAETRQAYQA